METTEFAHLGSVYRTNADASVIEAKDGSTWYRTGSMTVVLEARRILAQNDQLHQALSRLARNTM